MKTEHDVEVGRTVDGQVHERLQRGDMFEQRGETKMETFSKSHKKKLYMLDSQPHILSKSAYCPELRDPFHDFSTRMSWKHTLTVTFCPAQLAGCMIDHSTQRTHK